MGSRTQFVRTANGHIISVPQIPENLGLLSIDFAGLDIDPFRIPIPDANDKRCFCGSGDCGSGHEKSGLRPANGPNHLGKHSGS